MNGGSPCTLAPHLKHGEGRFGACSDGLRLAAVSSGPMVAVEVEAAKINGRRVRIDVAARDDRDVIGAGRHERTIASWSKFEARVADRPKTVLNG